MTTPQVNPDWATLPLFNRQGWTRVRFGDVVRMLKEQVDPQSGEVERYVAGEHMETENVHIRKWGTVGEGYLGPAFIRRFDAGQVLYGSRRTYLKKVALADFSGVTSNTTFVLEANPEKLLQRLLPWLMLSERFTKHSVLESKGSTNPYINFPDIAKFEFDLPPLDQQWRIADLLWAIDDVAQKNIVAVENAEQVLVARLTDEFGDNPSRHPIKFLSEVVSLRTGIAKGKSYAAKVPTVELPYLRVANVQDGHLDLSEMKNIILPEADRERYLLQDGDVVICEGGDFDKVGRGAIWRNQVADCVHQNHVFSLRANRSLTSPEFLAFQLNSPYGKRYFLGCAKKTSNLASVNSTQVKQFPLQLPTLEEQQRLVDECHSLEKIIQTFRAHIKASRATLQVLVDTLT